MQPEDGYEAGLCDILRRRDWAQLREFSRTHNQIPDDVYGQGDHFWQVLLHKLTCNRLDLFTLHDESRAWLQERGYTTDIGGY